MARYLTLISLLFSLAVWSQAQAAIAFAVVPSDYYDTNGEGGGNSIPFGTNAFCDDGIRYQQLLLGSSLGGGNVGSISFRLDESASSDFGPITYGGVTVRLSSTMATPATMSQTFADNTGPDETIVFQGDLQASASIQTPTPNPFDFTIPVNTSFEFDGSLHNLLVDITITDCYAGPTVFFDRVGSSELARLFSTDKDSSMGDNEPGGVGLITAVTLSTPPPSFTMQGMTGNWMIDGHNGEGFMIDVLDSGAFAAFWFTYDEFGNLMWLYGVDPIGIVGDEVTVEFLLPDGPVFGSTYDPDDFYTDFWGLGTFRFTSCTEAEFTYNSVLGMGAGSYTLSKLYDVEQSSCP